MNENLSVSWRRVAIGLGLVLVAALVTLVVVVAENDVDVLSTVALALAVLAFGAQLVTSLVTGQTMGEQRVQVERINNETLALLTGIESTATALRGTVERQFDSVLGHLVNITVPEALRETPVDASRQDVEEAVVGRIRSQLGAFIGGTTTIPTGELLDARPGDLIVHQTFGSGEVESVEGEGDHAEATIRFDDVGVKRVLLSWAPLRLIRRGEDRGDL